MPNTDILDYSTLPLTTRKKIEISPMDEKSLKIITIYTAQEGWNPGKYEAVPLLTAAGSGFKVLKINGEPIASLCSAKYRHFAFIGHYFVRKDFRGKGLGKFLWDATLKELIDYNSIGLNAIIEQIEKYEKSGFVKTKNHNIRWFGIPKKLEQQSYSTNISLRHDFSLASLIDYDRSIFSTSRADFLNKWITMPESHTLAAVDEQSNLKGYTCISLSKDGYKIAPLFADSLEIAQQLYNGIVNFIRDEKNVYLDTCENNPAACLLAKKIGLKELFRSLPMWKGGSTPKAAFEKVYSITSQELGMS